MCTFATIIINNIYEKEFFNHNFNSSCRSNSSYDGLYKT